jgi:RNA polymerase sigma-70 factor (ECF subfamily)
VTFFRLAHLLYAGARLEENPAKHSVAQKMPAHLENEQSLVAAAKAGNSDAFVVLLNQYSCHIYRLGVSITGSHHDAEDVLQEASLKAYTALGDFQGNSRFYTWLVRIAVNVALGKLRKRALWKESSLDEPREGEAGGFIPMEIESWGEDPEKPVSTANCNRYWPKLSRSWTPGRGPSLLCETLRSSRSRRLPR